MIIKLINNFSRVMINKKERKENDKFSRIMINFPG
jgi:hypothetical protein